GRPAGSGRGRPEGDRGIGAPGRGAEGQGRAPRGASGPERGRAQGADRVPGQGEAGRAGTSRTAGLEAGRGSVGDRPAPEGRGAADVGSPGRGGRATPEREGGSRTLADDRLAPGDAARGLSGGSRRQLARWREGNHPGG